ncbi:MAG: acyl-CoA dehydrogenase family protein [Acidimicrobiales bacterium]
MDTELTDDQEALRDTVRRFLADRAPLAPYVRSMLDDVRGTTPEVWNGLAQLGLTGLLVPESHGGAGMGMVEMGVVLQEMGRMLHPGPFLSSAVAAVSAVAILGDDGDRTRLLAKLADGRTVGTVALLEPDARFQWRSPATRAAVDGEAFLLHGTKVFVPDALGSDLFLVSARTADATLGVFEVEAGTAGLDVGPTVTTDPTRRYGTLSLRAAPARRLGGPGGPDASAGLSRVLDRLVVAQVIDGVGAAEMALQMSVAYAKQRVQFGKPIGSFQAVQHRCTEMLQSLELGRAGAWWALWAADAATPELAHQAAVMAKAWAAAEFPSIGASAIQVHGGIGFTWEHDIHLFYKRLLTLEQAHGAAAEHLEELAGLVL